MKIYKYGTYYNPANNHYGETNGSVNCDRCHKKSLNICIGWQTYDLCIECIHDINKHMYTLELGVTPTFTSTPTFTPTPMMPKINTNMEQFQFRT